MAIHGVTWIKLLITFGPEILDAIKELFKDVPKEKIIKAATKAREITGKIEEISTGDQKETWQGVNKVVDAIFPDGIDIENP